MPSARHPTPRGTSYTVITVLGQCCERVHVYFILVLSCLPCPCDSRESAALTQIVQAARTQLPPGALDGPPGEDFELKVLRALVHVHVHVHVHVCPSV